jgi:hypothetical protein
LRHEKGRITPKDKADLEVETVEFELVLQHILLVLVIDEI